MNNNLPVIELLYACKNFLKTKTYPHHYDRLNRFSRRYRVEKKFCRARRRGRRQKKHFLRIRYSWGNFKKEKGGHFNRLSADICRQSYEIESIRPSESSFQTAFIIILGPLNRNADRLVRLLRVRAVYAAKSPAESDKVQSHLR